MLLSDEDVADLIAQWTRVQREREIASRADLERVQRERGTALRADLERVQLERETALRADLEREYQQKAKWEKGFRKREMERLQYKTELECLQPDVEMPMLPLLEGPQQSAPMAVTLTAEAPAAEVMTDNRVFLDTAAPDASVERAAIKLTSAAGSSSKICGERRVFRYYNSSCPKHDSNSSSSNGSNSKGSSSSSNDSTSNYDPWCDATCVVALLRPCDPGKGGQRDVRRGKAVLGVDLPFDCGKSWGRMQH